MTTALPPFKLAAPAPVGAAGWSAAPIGGLAVGRETDTEEDSPPLGRARLAALDPHLHCSVIGTCLTTGELRKIMRRFIDVRDNDDLEVHHEAVRLVSDSRLVAKAVHKALDHRHAAVLQRFARTRGAQVLGELWNEALREGEIPGAYWAVLTHRDATAGLRKEAFGQVHMLSHLVGAANRADIRRLVALEADNAALRQRLEEVQEQALSLQEERAEQRRTIDQLRFELSRSHESLVHQQDKSATTSASSQPEAAASTVALQTERRERAEQVAAAAQSERSRLERELEHLRLHVSALSRELAAAESELSEGGEAGGCAERVIDRRLDGQRVLYVGGRPSTTPSIRALVLRRGAEFQRHGGGLEDRKGMLASCVGWATVVVSPVDCIDHDSANSIKRLCVRHGVEFKPLRSVGVASFAAAFSGPADSGHRSGASSCLKHG